VITEMQKQRYLEAARDACRWYMRNQNTDAHPWGGVKDSADKGRFLYEWFPASGTGRGAGVWAQALGIMALHAVNIRTGKESAEYRERLEAAKLAGRYLLSLQRMDTHREELRGAFDEHVPGEGMSYVRDSATGGMGLCALYRMTGEEEYLERARAYAEWYRRYGCDAEGWPWGRFDLTRGKGMDREGHVRGDWQAGGGLFYYYLASLTGEKRYIEECLVPMMDLLVDIYRENPGESVVEGFHGEVPVSCGNDDFALVALLAAYRATSRAEYLETARERITGLLNIMDPDTGRFPSFGGTFVSGISMHVLNELDASEGRTPDPRLAAAVELTAENALELQARDYTNPRVHGGFWGQSHFGVGRHHIHHRSTGYAAIFYTMLSGGEEGIPYYHCLHW